MATKDDNDETKTSSYDRWTLEDPSAIQYGYFAQTNGAGIETFDTTTATTTSPFYITTAINYTNGPAHMGHAYEAVTSDVIARFHRCSEGERRPCFFLTGADEHGQKIANTAASQGQEPIDICDKYVIGFQRLNQRLLISNDDYVRTTRDRHKRTAQALWKKLEEAGDLYLDTYEGWYNIREETFVTDKDAALLDYKDPVSGAPLKQVQEASYFFRMSKYLEPLLEHIRTTNPNFIQPPHQANLILKRLEDQEEGLRDLSISRTTFDWGIPVPEGFEPNHVMYVWVDALSNYLTGVEGLSSTTTTTEEESSSHHLSKFWPASVHIIGKDILWFHTVIWPCLLMSAGLPLPKQVFAHGFVNDAEGKKMSKSMGNVVNPHDMLDQMSVDTFRWYLCREAPYGGELSFSISSLHDMHNADLCDTCGNLIHRATNLCIKYCNGVIPNVVVEKGALPEDWSTTVLSEYCLKMSTLELQAGASIAIQGFRIVNGYLTDEAPWLKKGVEHTTARQIVVRATLEALYVLSHLLLPFVPVGTAAIFDEKLNTAPLSSLQELATKCTTNNNLVVGTKISVGNVLYTKLGEEEEEEGTDKKQQQGGKKKESWEEAQRRKKAQKAAAIAASKAGQKGGGATSASASSVDQPDFYKMEIRVGKIVKVWNHEEAETLYCEEIDLGNEGGGGGIRQVASGLRPYYTLDEMHNKLVLVVCNLKATKLVGFVSNGMVLAAKTTNNDNNDSKVELVEPPPSSVIGERVQLRGISNFGGDPLSSAQVKKRKMWDKVVSKNLQTNQDGIATWDGKVLTTSAGPCKVPSLTNAPIS